VNIIRYLLLKAPMLLFNGTAASRINNDFHFEIGV